MACPYFRHENHECDLTASGIFVPSANHVVVFCSTQFFPECKHFLKGSHLYERAQPQHSLGPEHAGRRRFARFDGRYALAIKRANGGVSSGQLDDSLDENAIAVNYSQGGVRVESGKRLPENRPLFIHFAKDFIIPELRGLAHVCWQRQEDQQWTAGLAFDDACVGALIALQVEL